jgi:glycosyltransferase involved in cell wall biosynthesis
VMSGHASRQSQSSSTSPKRILIVTWELQPDSGWGRYSLGLVRGLLERGHQLTILTTRNTKAPPLDARVIPCLSTPLGALDRPLPFAWNMAQVLKHAPGHDLVHFFVEPFALAASAVFPWPYLITVHGTYGVSPFRMNAVTRTLFARTLKRAASVVCVSGYTRRRMGEVLPLDNLDVVTNGFDPLTVPAGHFDGEISGHPVLMGSGALKPRKGYHTVLEALPAVRKRHPDVHYYLVGDDQDRKYVAGLRESIQRLDLAGNATITGRINEAYLDALYRRADAFVLPSENSGAAFEGFGLAYIEANAYGKPVIGTLDCGAEDAIDDGDNGLLVPQRDPSALSAAMLRLLDDPAAARAMGERGRERSNSRDWSHVVDEYLVLYDRALSRRSAM